MPHPVCGASLPWKNRGLISNSLAYICTFKHFLEPGYVSQADRSHNQAPFVKTLFLRRDLEFLENFHHIVHLKVVKSYLKRLGSDFLYYFAVGKGICSSSLISHCEAGCTKQDAAEIAYHHYKYIAQFGRQDLPQDGAAGGRRWFSVVIRTPPVTGKAEAVRIAMMPCVEIFLFKGRDYDLDLSFRRNRIRERKKFAPLVFI